MTPRQEQTLIRQLKQGDERAFHRLVTSYQHQGLQPRVSHAW